MQIPYRHYLKIKEKSVTGRYVNHQDVEAYLQKVKTVFQLKEVGRSVENRTIKSITLGNGPTKILIWSQMHGNESTTTKAVLDFLNFMRTDKEMAGPILKSCTIKIIPMLNPDGAEVYTRTNANGVDLNRDAQDRSQPESVTLRKAYDHFLPDFCFNLHDQRTLFNVGTTNKPATVSFLAPAHDEERTISPSRKKSMQLIVAMNQSLQELIPGQVGRYDDSFNANCVGDTFQMLNTPTVLFESGHFPKDYGREETRKYIFHAMLKGVTVISENKVGEYDQKRYFRIPENQKLFLDLLIKNAQLIKGNAMSKSTFTFQFKEVLKDGEIQFLPEIQHPENDKDYFFHTCFDCAVRRDLQALKEQKYYPIIEKVFKTLF